MVLNSSANPALLLSHVVKLWGFCLVVAIVKFWFADVSPPICRGKLLVLHGWSGLMVVFFLLFT